MRASILVATALSCAAGAAAADVYGNKGVAWTNNDSIIFDLQRKRAQMERAASGPTSQQLIEAWVRGRQEARRQWVADEGDRAAARATRSKPKPQPEAPRVSYEAWSEDHNRKRANAGDLDGMYLYGRRLLETGRSHGQGWLEDAAKRGDLDSAKYLLDRANGLSGGKKDLGQKRRWLTLLMNRPNDANARWHYGELLAATYDGSEGPRDASGLARVLEGLLKGGDEHDAAFHPVAATQLSELYSSGEGVTHDLERALALAREALAHTRHPTSAQWMQLAAVLAMSEGSYRDHHAEIVRLWFRAAEGKGPGQARAVDQLLALFAGENESLASFLPMDELRRTSPVRREHGPARENLFRAGQGGCRRAWEELIEALDQHGFPKRHELTYESRTMLDGAGKAGFARAYGIVALKAARSSDLTTRSVGRDYAEKGIALGDPTSFAARALLAEGDSTPDWGRIAADYRKAADGGLLLGMVRLAEILRSGHLGGRNNLEAFEWMNRAADGGLARARCEVARMLIEGEGVSREPERGLAILEEATRHELPIAFRMFGHYLVEGRVVTRNTERGYSKLLYAARAGDVEAMDLVGLIHLRGTGRPPNRAEARVWFKQAAEREHPRALSHLAELIWTEPRPADQQAQFAKAAQENDRSPNDALTADLEIFQGAINDLDRIAGREPAEVQAQIGLLLLNKPNEFSPPFGFRSPDAARLRFEPAALAGDAAAQFYSAMCLIDYARRSKGTEYDVAYSRKGLEFLRQAAAAGHPAASQVLTASRLEPAAAPADRAAWDRLQAAVAAAEW